MTSTLQKYWDKFPAKHSGMTAYNLLPEQVFPLYGFPCKDHLVAQSNGCTIVFMIITSGNKVAQRYDYPESIQ